MIDAIVNNRCCVAIIDDIFKPTQEQAVHFRQMIESKAFHVVYSAREAVLLSSKLIQGEDTRWKYRREFVKNFIRPRGLDLNVGELAAKSIERIVSEKVHNLLHGQQT